MQSTRLVATLFIPFTIAALALPLLAQPGTPRGRTLVAVFAHPDDETMVGGVLAESAAQGAMVHLVLATSGDKGVTPFAKIPAGDALATARARETECAAAALGIEPPVMLGFPDGGLADTVLLARLAARLQDVLRDLAPDAILTWGPEGGYGHPDHRLVGAVVTQIVQASGTTAQLYYPGFPKSALESGLVQSLKFPAPFSPVSDDRLNVRISYSPASAQKARAALRCHASQFTPEVMDQLSGLTEQLLKGTAHLRAWNGGPPRTGLFDCAVPPRAARRRV